MSQRSNIRAELKQCQRQLDKEEKRKAREMKLLKLKKPRVHSILFGRKHRKEINKLQNAVKKLKETMKHATGEKTIEKEKELKDLKTKITQHKKELDEVRAKDKEKAKELKKKVCKHGMRTSHAE